jgi:hypothetical protein
MANIRCKFVVADFTATEISLLIISNEFFVAKISNGKSVAGFVNQQRIVRC